MPQQTTHRKLCKDGIKREKIHEYRMFCFWQGRDKTIQIYGFEPQILYFRGQHSSELPKAVCRFLLTAKRQFPQKLSKIDFFFAFKM